MEVLGRRCSVGVCVCDEDAWPEGQSTTRPQACGMMKSAMMQRLLPQA